eukprot:snap_masked-scaffold_4-processed-gene-8.24-mRNA-1 protein AED:1.00 eAED:1.00 QI:0/-1/0/0/-1/1/1/0/299
MKTRQPIKTITKSSQDNFENKIAESSHLSSDSVAYCSRQTLKADDPSQATSFSLSALKKTLRSNKTTRRKFHSAGLIRAKPNYATQGNNPTSKVSGQVWKRSSSSCNVRPSREMKLNEPGFKKEKDVVFDVEPFAKVDLRQCEYCLRKFSIETINRHRRVCLKQPSKQILSQNRSEYDMIQKRLASVAQQNKVSVKNLVSLQENESKSKPSRWYSWKQQSLQLRFAVKTSTDAGDREYNYSQRDRVQPIEDSYVLCENCGRRFNELAAERHIPKCRDMKHKPKRLLKGSGNYAANRRKQ